MIRLRRLRKGMCRGSEGGGMEGGKEACNFI